MRADENVPFGAFATVMDAVKQSGITNVSIVTQPLEKQWQPTLTSSRARAVFACPLIGSVALHVALFALALFGYLIPFGRGESWGGTTGGGGAMSATLVTSIPLPAPQTQTQNVLANESKGLTAIEAERRAQEKSRRRSRFLTRETKNERPHESTAEEAAAEGSRQGRRQQDSLWRGRSGQRTVRFVSRRRTPKAD